MTLEQQVTSVEISKKLKELEVKQESLFWWVEFKSFPVKYWQIVDEDDKKHLNFPERTISAFTVAELLELLPASTSVLKRTDFPTNKIPRYYAEVFDTHYVEIYDKNPANACAKLLIHLLENKLITLK